MRLLTKAAFAALLLGTTAIAAPAFADDTGCPPGLHRADSEGGQNNGAVRRANSEGGQNNAVRQADSEGGQNNRGSPRSTPRAVRTTRSARLTSEGGQNNAVRRADSEGGQNNNAVRRPIRRWSEQQAVRQADSEGGQNNAVRQADFRGWPETRRCAALAPRAGRTITRSAAPAIAPSRTAALAPCK